MASEIFDFNEEIEFIDQAPDRYGVEVEDFFYLCRMCGMVAVIMPVFEAERTEKGCIVTGYGKIAIHSIEIRNATVFLGSQLIADKTPATREYYFAGPADSPAAWESVVRNIFKAERAILQMTDFPGRIKAEWVEFIRVRQDRLGF